MKTEKQTKPAGGALIVLSMQGFGERWHPGEKQERLCAAGRMLYLSPYEPQGAKLDKREMHIRAHALVVDGKEVVRPLAAEDVDTIGKACLFNSVNI